MKFFERLNSVLDQGASKQIFDHVRNYLICAFILAIGTTDLRQGSPHIFQIIPGNFVGIGAILLGCILILFNLYDGLRRIGTLEHNIILKLGLVLLYLIVSIRVIEMAWNFRDIA